MTHCKFYALYGTRCGCDERINKITPLSPPTVPVLDHRACMGEIPSLCQHYKKVSDDKS